MPTSLTASRRVASPLLLATTCFSLLAVHCSSDEGTQPVGGAGTPATPGGSGSGGSASQGGSTAGMAAGGVVTAAGTASAGTSAGTPTTAGAAGTATTGGSGGAGGGSSGGSAGGSAGTGSGGGGSALFTAVKASMAKSCGVGKCHNSTSGELNYQVADADTLHKNLTSAVPTGAKHCQGSIAVTPNDTNSLLLRVLKGNTTCTNNGANQNIGKMPDNCPANNIACLTETEIKVYSDWIAAGAPK